MSFLVENPQDRSSCDAVPVYPIMLVTWPKHLSNIGIIRFQTNQTGGAPLAQLVDS